MYYIIDGNNLAGKLGLIGQKDFDKQVIEFVQDSHIAHKDVILVFDSLEIMGNKQQLGKITVIYSPKDSRYDSADDRIIELLEIYAQNKDRRPITLITEDIEIIEISTILAKQYQCEIFSLKSNSFINNLQFGKPDADEKELDEDDINEINKELLKLWS